MRNLGNYQDRELFLEQGLRDDNTGDENMEGKQQKSAKPDFAGSTNQDLLKSKISEGSPGTEQKKELKKLRKKAAKAAKYQ